MGKGLILKVTPDNFKKLEEGQNWVENYKPTLHENGELIKIIESLPDGETTGNYIMGNITGSMNGMNDSYVVSFIKTCIIKPRVLVPV